MSGESGVNSSTESSSNRLEFITAGELAKQFGVTKATIMRWRKLDLITAICLGGRVYFHLPTVEKEILEMSPPWTNRGRRPRKSASEQPTDS
jgi:hypothetical protein